MGEYLLIGLLEYFARSHPAYYSRAHYFPEF